jgi:hypothetical protein
VSVRRTPCLFSIAYLSTTIHGAYTARVGWSSANAAPIVGFIIGPKAKTRIPLQQRARRYEGRARQHTKVPLQACWVTSLSVKLVSRSRDVSVQLLQIINGCETDVPENVCVQQSRYTRCYHEVSSSTVNIGSQLKLNRESTFLMEDETPARPVRSLHPLRLTRKGCFVLFPRLRLRKKA